MIVSKHMAVTTPSRKISSFSTIESELRSASSKLQSLTDRVPPVTIFRFSEAIRTTSVEATGHDAMQAFWRVSQVEMVPVLSPTSSVLSFVYAWMNWRRCKFVKIKIKIVGTERPAERHGVGNAARTGQHQAQFSRTSEVKCPSRSSSGTGATWTFRT